MQIAEYAAGRQRIVKHVGSAHTEAELGVLLARAQELLEDPAQATLWGLARSIRLEHPELRCRCVDLDTANGGWSEAAQIELTVPSLTTALRSA